MDATATFQEIFNHRWGGKGVAAFRVHLGVATRLVSIRTERRCIAGSGIKVMFTYFVGSFIPVKDYGSVGFVFGGFLRGEARVFIIFYCRGHVLNFFADFVKGGELLFFYHYVFYFFCVVVF